jgi:UDP-glucuronate 4-epimerase
MALLVVMMGRHRQRHDLRISASPAPAAACRWWLLRTILLFSINSAIRMVQARTILVTGGAGFVGSHLADALLARGDNVVIVDEVNDYYDVQIKEGNLQMLQSKYNIDNNDDEKENDRRVTIYRGDICDRPFLDQVFARHAFDDIAHMAARAGVRPSIIDPFIYVHSNIKGTIALLDRAVRYNITNFVFASSSSVYGGSTSTFFSELDQVDHPISPYAATKKACELFAYAYHKKFGIHTAALRFFTVYGPRGRPDMAVWYVY